MEEITGGKVLRAMLLFAAMSCAVVLVVAFFTLVIVDDKMAEDMPRQALLRAAAGLPQPLSNHHRYPTTAVETMVHIRAAVLRWKHATIDNGTVPVDVEFVLRYAIPSWHEGDSAFLESVRLPDDPLLQANLVEIRNAYSGDIDLIWEKAEMQDHLASKLMLGLVEPSSVIISEVWLYPWYWIAAYILFSIAFGTYVNKRSKRIAWRQIGALVAAVTVLPTLVLFRVVAILNRMPQWDVAALCRRVLDALSVVGYRLRLVRQMPAPVLHHDAVEAFSLARVRDGEPPIFAEAAEEAAEQKWYLFRKEMVLGMRHVLQEIGIVACTLRIKSPSAMEGIAIPQDRLVDALEALGLKLEDATKRKTDISGVTFLDTGFPPGNVEATVGSHLEAPVLEVLRAVSMRAGCPNIRLLDLRWSREAGAEEDGWVTICLRAGTRNESSFVHADAEGKIVPLRGFTGVKPGPKGYVVRDDRGVAVAQVAGRTITLLFDFMDHEGAQDAAFETMARILHDAMETLRTLSNLTPAERTSREASHSGDLAREQYADSRVATLVEEERQLADHVAECDAVLERAGTAVFTAMRSREGIRDRLASFANGETDAERERLGNEFDRLYAADGVVAVSADEEKVTIETDLIAIPHENKLYHLGRFLIILGYNGSIQVRVVQGTRLYFYGIPHPHINEEGDVCFGNASSGVAKLMAKREYAAVGAIMLRFLSTWNPTGHDHVHISKWTAIDPAKHRARRPMEKKRFDAKHRERYVTICAERLVAVEKQLKADLERVAKELSSVHGATVAAARGREVSVKRLSQLRDGRLSCERERALHEFDRIMALPEVASVNGFASRVEAFTHPITMTGDDGERYLGRFKLTFCEDGTIRVTCIDKTSKHRHPHVNSAGRPRLGGFSVDVKRHMARREYADAAGLLCRFLRTPQDGDRWAIPLTEWPETETMKETT